MAVEKSEKRRPSVSSSSKDKKDESKSSEASKRKSSGDPSASGDKKIRIEKKDREGGKSSVKIARKTSTTSTTSKSSKDVKKTSKPRDFKFAKFSEEEALDQEKVAFGDISNDFSTTVTSIKEVMKNIIVLKNEGLEDRDKLSQLRTEGCLKLSLMKRLNRLAQISAKKQRESTKNLSLSSDSHHLKLQNLQYQVHHLQCEIDQCVGFTSLHKSLTLVDEDEFQLEAPEEITLEAAKSEHDLTLGRLKYELLQRQKLKEKLEQVERNREELDEVANRKRTNLNNIRPHMQTILQAANNVRSKLSLGGVVGIIGEAASFLTEPLSTIYKAGIAFRQSNHGRLEISVKGDEKEAIEMKEKGFEMDETEGRNESIEGEEGSSRRSRRKKKSLKGWFPVWVEWKIGEKIVQFRHSTINKQVYAESSKDSHTPELSCLFTSDAGIEQNSSSRSNQFGRAYWWAAQLAGQQDLPSGQSFSTFVSEVVDRIEKRFKNAEIFSNHLEKLMNKELPQPTEDNILLTGSFASFEPIIEFDSARGISQYEDGKVYQIEIERKTESKLIAAVSVSPNYPIDPPRFSISTLDGKNASNSTLIHCLEEHVNLRLPLQLDEQEQEHVFSKQISALLAQQNAAEMALRNRFLALS